MQETVNACLVSGHALMGKAVRTSRVFVVALFVMLLSACGGGGDPCGIATPCPDAVTALAVSPPSGTLNVGQSLTLIVTSTTARTTGVSLVTTYASSAPGVATVSSSGQVTAIATGTATITVTVTGSGENLTSTTRTATALVTVNALPEALRGITLLPAAANVRVGETVTVAPLAETGGAGVALSYTYSSGDATVATVSGTGVVTGVRPGTAIITAVGNGSGAGFSPTSRSATATITVLPFALTALSVSAGRSVVPVTQTEQIQANVSRASGAQSSTTFTSRNPTIASVSASGLVTANATGTAVIVVEASGQGTNFSSNTLRDSITINVAAVNAVLNVTLGSSRTSIPIEETAQLTPGVQPGGAAVTWIATYSTSNPSVVLVSSTGVVSAVASGSAFVRVTVSGQGAPFTANVVVDSVPITVTFSATRLVAGLAHACARVSTGSWYCWGENGVGQLGLGFSGPPVTTPRRVQAPAGVAYTLLAAGRGHTCGMTADDAAYCWGNNDAGQLGGGFDGGVVPAPTRVQLPAGVRLVEMDGGAAHMCGRSQAGVPYCWGSARWGELGNDSFSLTPFPSPVLVLMPSGVVANQIEAGWLNACVITNTGSTLCWGYNFNGELGDGTNTWRSVPTGVQQPAGGPFVQLSRQELQSCARNGGGEVFCWGPNELGQGGTGISTSSPLLAPTKVLAPVGRSYVSIGTAERAACAITTSGAIDCWGQNADGQLGRGVTSPAANPLPLAVNAPPGVSFVEVVGGGAFFCARASTGAVYCWGSNVVGQLGNGTFVPQSTPTRIP